MSSPKNPKPEQNAGARRRAVLVAVQPPDRSDAEAARSMDELAHLAAGLGWAADARHVQKRDRPAPATYLGGGKLRELAALTGGPGEPPRGPEDLRPEKPLREDLVVVVDDELGPSQARNLEAALGAPVVDRTNLILRVFESRAGTKAARLEIELARLAYQLSRVRDDHSLGDREGGGGRASRGHSNVELAKQRSRERMAALRAQLEHERAIHGQQRQARADVFRVALVGYTNAGKSSLMRLLTGSEVFVQDQLFATLGTTVRPLRPPAVPPILLVDTVGFIDRLPHDLVASFRATLSEATEAWLLLHVVDASDPAFRAQLRVSKRVLGELGAADTPAWVVLNKVDRLSAAEREALAAEHPDALQVSALDAADGRALRQRLVDHFERHLEVARLTVPYERHGVVAALRDQVRILHESYDEHVEVTVAGLPGALARLRRQLA